MNFPTKIAIDADGNLYIADLFNFRVRKVSPDGIITTIAGNGMFYFSSLDGGQAVDASLTNLFDVAVDTDGNLYIIDSNRVRKVGLDGIITTVAGGGSVHGDGGPATSASLNVPFGIAVNTAGNLYNADTFNNRIRKVSLDGIITTVVGNGIRTGVIDGEGGDPADDLGDGGPATSASLAMPNGVAVDAAGNLYIADSDNQRIRKIGLDGIITTVAGSGDTGFFNGSFSGDNGPATSVLLSNPADVAVDAAGNLYIADTFNNRIRKVSADGIITTVAGGGSVRGDGGPATSASLTIPNGVAVDAAGNLYIAERLNDRIRKVLATPPSYSAFPRGLSFSAEANTPVVAAQRITVSSDVAGLMWSTQTTTETGGNWLSASPAVGSAPGVISVMADVSNLLPGTYLGMVTVLAPLAVPSTQTVSVALTVEAAPEPKLTIEPSELTFEITAGTGNPQARTLRIGNAGGGTLNWTALAETQSGGDWLNVSSFSGSASTVSPATVEVAVNTANLEPGVYSGSVLIESSALGQQETVAVTLLLSQPTQTILVSQNGLQFVAVEGGAVEPSQTFGILNTGEGVMDWSLQTETFSGGNWLSVSPVSGETDAASRNVPLIEVGVGAIGLPAGAYSGLIRVSSAGANNSPQFVTVTLNVLPPGSDPGVLVRPTNLIYTAVAGTFSPGSQLVRLAKLTPGSVEARSGITYLDDDGWLELLPPNLVISDDDPRKMVLQPTLGTLPPGTYRAQLAYQFSDGSPSQPVDILFLVIPNTAGTALVSRTKYGAAINGEGCTAQRMIARGRSLGNSFASPVAWPTTIEVLVLDDCGRPVTDAILVARFSNGDSPVALVSLRNGLYTGTWRPVNPNEQVIVTVRADLPSLPSVEVVANGRVNANAEAPILFSRGVVNAATFASGQALAPGSIVSVFGNNLAQGLNFASQLPLETTLGGTTLIVGGIEQPLFFSSDGQVNAQLPFALEPNSRVQMVVKTQIGNSGLDAITVPETITIAEARPGIFTTNQQGTGQGAILNQDSSPNSPENPEVVGNVIQVFSTGLGNTDPGVPSGQLAPSQEPLARVMVPVQAQIGGSSATVQFAGLAPGFVGLYQVNVQIPAGVEPGPEVPLVLFQNGVPSNTVTLAIQ